MWLAPPCRSPLDVGLRGSRTALDARYPSWVRPPTRLPGRGRPGLRRRVQQVVGRDEKAGLLIEAPCRYGRMMPDGRALVPTPTASPSSNRVQPDEPLHGADPEVSAQLLLIGASINDSGLEESVNVGADNGRGGPPDWLPDWPSCAPCRAAHARSTSSYSLTYRTIRRAATRLASRSGL